MHQTKKYKIIDIAHSGRKGERNTPVDDPKYDGLKDSVIESRDLEDMYQFETCHWNIVTTESSYKWWETTPMVALSKVGDMYKLETVNTIYVLEDVTND